MLASNATPNADPLPERLLTLAERISRSLAVARALIIAGRTVELAGIQDAIGMLCAKTLDLPSAQGRQMLPQLHELHAQIDSLSQAMHQRPTG